MFLEMAKRINEKPETDPKIPFNMLGVSFLNVEPVSYTHLDVSKRQAWGSYE